MTTNQNPEDLTGKLSELPKDQLVQTATDAGMPGAGSANKDEIVAWLSENKPDEAQGLVT